MLLVDDPIEEDDVVVDEVDVDEVRDDVVREVREDIEVLDVVVLIDVPVEALDVEVWEVVDVGDEVVDVPYVSLDDVVLVVPPSSEGIGPVPVAHEKIVANRQKRSATVVVLMPLTADK